MLKKIVVHAGNAHLDEVMACAIAIASQKICWPKKDRNLAPVIERRDPTAEELENPEVLVLDVGGRYEPEKSNFDHHQLPRENRESAMVLLARNIGLPGGGSLEVDNFAFVMERLFPWFMTRSVVDCQGPFAAAKEAGVEWKTVDRFRGPAEDLLLAAFVNASDEKRYEIVAPLAETIVNAYTAYDELLGLTNGFVDERGESLYETLKRLGVDAVAVDFRGIDGKLVDAAGDAVLDECGAEIVVFDDNRGDGWTVLRRNDSPKFDFAKCAGIPGVLFAHKGGFIAKTAAKNVQVLDEVLTAGYVAK